MNDKITQVTYAIMRAFFSRPVEEQIFNVSPVDNEDLARAAIEAMREIPKPMLGVVANNLDVWESDIARSWDAIIDEALK